MVDCASLQSIEASHVNTIQNYISLLLNKNPDSARKAIAVAARYFQKAAAVLPIDESKRLAAIIYIQPFIDSSPVQLALSKAWSFAATPSRYIRASILRRPNLKWWI